MALLQLRHPTVKGDNHLGGILVLERDQSAVEKYGEKDKDSDHGTDYQEAHACRPLGNVPKFHPTGEDNHHEEEEHA